jgi:hypothetical protein
MPAPRQNYYEVLGIPRTAKLNDVGRAYNRHKSELQKEDAAPDPKRAALLKEAYETLSDLDRRAAYDKSLVATKRRKGTKGAAVWGGAIAAGTAAVVASYLTLRPPPERPAGARSAEDIAQAATLAVGRVQRLDISGAATPIGLAFAIDQGVMVTSCHGVAPTAQLVVNLAPRMSPARVASVDEKLGLCKLAAEGVGGHPLTMSGAMPRAGETVYATKVNAVGEVALIEGRVNRVVNEPDGNVIDATIPVVPERAGGPLLDVFGRVVAVASFSHADGQGRHMAMPSAWLAEIAGPRPVAASPAPVSPTSPPAAPSPSDSTRIPKSARDIPPERLEKLEKAFRPPPTVPDDL